MCVSPPPGESAIVAPGFPVAFVAPGSSLGHDVRQFSRVQAGRG